MKAYGKKSLPDTIQESKDKGSVRYLCDSGNYFEVSQLPNGNIWIENQLGEGMEFGFMKFLEYVPDYVIEEIWKEF